MPHWIYAWLASGCVREAWHADGAQSWIRPQTFRGQCPLRYLCCLRSPAWQSSNLSPGLAGGRWPPLKCRPSLCSACAHAKCSIASTPQPRTRRARMSRIDRPDARADRPTPALAAQAHGLRSRVSRERPARLGSPTVHSGVLTAVAVELEGTPRTVHTVPLYTTSPRSQSATLYCIK